MAEEKLSSRIIESVLFPKIFQTFRMAIHPGKLIVALAAVLLICLTGWIMDLNKTVVTSDTENELLMYMQDPAQVQHYIETSGENARFTGVFSTLWRFGSARFHRALTCLFAFNLPGVANNIAEYFKAITWAARYHFFYTLLFVAVKLAVISIAGGAICRMAALQFAKGEKLGLTESVTFSLKRFLSFFTAPLVPVAIIVVLALLTALLGLLGNIPWLGELIMGIFTVLALLAGLLITIISIGTVAGFNLMFPAVAYDGSDCFDAISRSFSYIYTRPWRMGFYTGIAAVYGAICYTFVRFFAFLILWSAHASLQLGVLVSDSSKQLNKLAAIWPQPAFMNLVGSCPSVTMNWSESVASFLIYLLLLLVVGLVVAFVISFYFTANTIIYALMRNRVDNTSLDDIYTDRSDFVQVPAADEDNSAAPQPPEPPAASGA